MEKRENNIFLSGVLTEGLLILVALGLAWFGLYDHRQPLSEIQWAELVSSFWIGLVATIPIGLLMWIVMILPFEWVREFNLLVDRQVAPLFRDITIPEIFALSLMAGLGEEILFRWAIQGGLETLLLGSAGSTLAAGVAVLIASVLFGLCHALSTTYVVLTIVIGVYFGLLMNYTGSWIVPAVSHFVYDFFAILVISRRKRLISPDNF